MAATPIVFCAYCDCVQMLYVYMLTGLLINLCNSEFKVSLVKSKFITRRTF